MQHLQETLQEFAALRNDRPMGMPGAFYTSQEYYEHETRTVLRSGWHCLGREDEIPNAGDYFTVQLLNEPLLVVRGDDGNVRVLANVCRHRGMPLAEGSGKQIGSARLRILWKAIIKALFTHKHCMDIRLLACRVNL